MVGRKPRDSDLIDILDCCDPASVRCSLWRAVADARDPCQCSKPGGRWDDGTVEVLYTSLERDGAIAEIYFHLRKGQPVFPSKVKYRLHELQLDIGGIVDLTDAKLLSNLGVDMARYGQLTYVNRESEYTRSQQIGEAAYFLGFKGIKVPNARADCNNLILFCDQVAPDQLELINDHGFIDWGR